MTFEEPQLPAAGDVTEARHLTLGDRVTFADNDNRWTVRARGDRYVICTYTAAEEFAETNYTVIDLKAGIRGTDYFGINGYEEPDQIEQALRYFERGEEAIAVRTAVTLRIASIISTKTVTDRGPAFEQTTEFHRMPTIDLFACRRDGRPPETNEEEAEHG